MKTTSERENHIVVIEIDTYVNKLEYGEDSYYKHTFYVMESGINQMIKDIARFLYENKILCHGISYHLIPKEQAGIICELEDIVKYFLTNLSDDSSIQD